MGGNKRYRNTSMFILLVCLYKDLLIARISLMTWVHCVRHVYQDSFAYPLSAKLWYGYVIFCSWRVSGSSQKYQNLLVQKNQRDLHVTAKIGKNDQCPRGIQDFHSFALSILWNWWFEYRETPRELYYFKWCICSPNDLYLSKLFLGFPHIKQCYLYFLRW